MVGGLTGAEVGSLLLLSSGRTDKVILSWALLLSLSFFYLLHSSSFSLLLSASRTVRRVRTTRATAELSSSSLSFQLSFLFLFYPLGFSDCEEGAGGVGDGKALSFLLSPFESLFLSFIPRLSSSLSLFLSLSWCGRRGRLGV